jgi:hypothetical protein
MRIWYIILHRTQAETHPHFIRTHLEKNLL